MHLLPFGALRAQPPGGPPPPEREGYRWEPGHWDWRGEWVWIPGHWLR